MSVDGHFVVSRFVVLLFCCFVVLLFCCFVVLLFCFFVFLLFVFVPLTFVVVRDAVCCFAVIVSSLVVGCR
jgi:hypothetical protein